MGPASLLEEAANLVFSWSTWAPFAAVADRYKVGIELAKEAWREGRLRDLWDLFKPQKKKKKKKDWRGEDTDEDTDEDKYTTRQRLVRAASLLLGTATGTLPLALAFTRGRRKWFGRDAGDNDVLGLTDKEESMAYVDIEFEPGNARITGLTLVTIGARCGWLVRLVMRECEGVDADVACVGLLVNLKVLDCSECGNLAGA